MTQRRQVKFLKVNAVDPPLGVHRLVYRQFLSMPFSILQDLIIGKVAAFHDQLHLLGKCCHWKFIEPTVSYIGGVVRCKRDKIIR